MARVKQELRRDLAAIGLLAAMSEDLIFLTLPTAVAEYRLAWPIDPAPQ
jgi:SulP family sulfate permease